MKHSGALGVGLLLVVGLIVADPSASAARHHRPSLSVKRVHAHSVVLHGRTHHRGGHVKVQVRKHHRWKAVKRVRIHRHRFKARVHQSRHRARYRVVTHGHASRSVVVRLRSGGRSPEVGRSDSGTPQQPPLAALLPPINGVVGLLENDPTASPARAPSDACGPRPRKPDGSYWSCTFHDEFDGTSLDPDKWMVQTNFVTGTPGAHACYTDSPDNVSVAGGTLNLTVRREANPIPCQNRSMGASADYSSGSVMTYGRFSQQYGMFSARIKPAASRVPGLQETWWLWPDVRYDTSRTVWPAAGEIDVAETYSRYPSLNIPFLHYTYNDNGGPIPGVNTTWSCGAQRGKWNTVTLIWTPHRLQIWTNGAKCLDNTSDDPAFDKRYIMALTQSLGTTGNLPSSSTPFPATMQVDYVRVWK